MTAARSHSWTTARRAQSAHATFVAAPNPSTSASGRSGNAIPMRRSTATIVPSCPTKAPQRSVTSQEKSTPWRGSAVVACMREKYSTSADASTGPAALAHPFQQLDPVPERVVHVRAHAAVERLAGRDREAAGTARVHHRRERVDEEADVRLAGR